MYMLEKIFRKRYELYYNNGSVLLCVIFATQRYSVKIKYNRHICRILMYISGFLHTTHKRKFIFVFVFVCAISLLFLFRSQFQTFYEVLFDLVLLCNNKQSKTLYFIRKKICTVSRVEIKLHLTISPVSNLCTCKTWFP